VFNLFWRPFVPGFHVRPHDDVPGFNIDENGLPRRESAWSDGQLRNWVTQRSLGAAQPELPYSLSLPTPSFARLVQSAPPIGLAGFHVDPQDDTPGFNVRPGDDVPGFNLNDDSQQQETILSAPTPLPDAEEPVQPGSPQFPEWIYKLITMLPEVLASGPLIGRQVAVNLPPSPPSTEPPAVNQWPSSPMPQRSPGMSISRPSVATQSTGTQALDQSALLRTWPQPRNDGWPYSQAAKLHDPWSAGTASRPISFPTMLEPKPPEGLNFIPVNAPSVGGEQMQPQTRLHQPKQTQPSSLLGTVTPGSDGPSVGQKLVQSSVDTIVPGAYYQKLAREQLGAGNYLGAGVYQGAALLDAALGAATLGLSTRLSAGVRAAAGEGAALFRRVFDSRSQLWRYLGRAPEGMQWHHIVEQFQVPQFGQRAIQSVENIVAIPIEAHQRLNAFYSSKLPFAQPNTVREWLRGQSFEAQYEFGMKQLKRVLGY
jgi:hypothetical protein